MASVTFSSTVGGDGSTVSDDANATTGLANGGHRTRFVPALGQVVAVANKVVTDAAAAVSAAASAVNAPGTNATSTSSVAIGTGSKTLTIQTGKAYTLGQWVVVADSSNATNYLFGQITAYNSGTGSLTVNVTEVGGSGTLSSWVMGLSGPQAPRNIPSVGAAKTSSYTLAVTDVGKFVEVGSGGSITVPNATFGAGDVVSIFNNTASSITLTMSITTAYAAGADIDKATMTLVTRGVATVLFISGTVCVVSGNVS